MNKITWDYIAGFIDGEGFVGISRANNKYNNKLYVCFNPIINITNTDKKVVYRIKYFLKINNIVSFLNIRKNDSGKTRYDLSVRNIKSSELLLKKIKNRLIVKHKLAELVYKFLKLKKNKRHTTWGQSAYTDEMKEIFCKIKGINSLGKKKEYILITGIAGFLMSHIANDLIKLGYNIIGLDDLSGGFKINIPKGVKFIKGDICDEELIKDIFNNYKINYVYHGACYAAECLSPFIKLFNCRNNLMGSLNLINQSIIYKVKCFVFFSSIAVYGKNQVPMKESMSPKPEDSYGIAKYAVEMELKNSKKIFNMDYIIFRPFNIYGENQNIGDKYRNVIGIFMNQIMQNKALTIFGDGEQQRGFTYVKDISPIIAISAFNNKAYNQIFNIGANKPYTINQLIKKLKRITKKNIKIKNLKERHEVKIAFSDSNKLKKYFNFDIKHTLNEGLKNMWKWAIKHGARQSKVFKNIEIKKGLPEGW